MMKKLKEVEEFSVFLFPVVTLYIAPIIHEYIHALVLDFYRCPYNMLISFTLSGVYGHLEPLCYMTTYQTVAVLVAPVLVTLSIGMFLFGLSFEHHLKGYPFTPIFFSSIAIGFVVSAGLDFFSRHSDIRTAMSSMGIDVGNFVFYLTGTVIIVVAVLLYLDVLFELNKAVQGRRPKGGRR